MHTLTLVSRLLMNYEQSRAVGMRLFLWRYNALQVQGLVCLQLPPETKR